MSQLLSFILKFIFDDVHLFSRQLDYDISKPQLNFLHLLSSTAFQEITIHCRNVPVWRNRKGNYDNALSFRGWNGVYFTHDGPFTPEILEDSCQVSA